MVDGDVDAETIVIDVEKRGQTQQQVGEIAVHQTLFDVGHGTIFVLQLVCQHSLCNYQRRVSIYVPAAPAVGGSGGGEGRRARRKFFRLLCHQAV